MSPPANTIPCPVCDVEIRRNSQDCPECKTLLRSAIAAGKIRRVAAFLVDIILLSVTVGPLNWILQRVASPPAIAPGAKGLDAFFQIITADFSRLGIHLLPLLCLASLYFLLFLGLNGRTIGHQALSLRLVNREAEHPSWLSVFIRTLLFFLSAPWGALWTAFDHEGRSFYDHLSGTYLIREQS